VDERVVIDAVVDGHAHVDDQNQHQQASEHAQVVGALQRPAAVPGAGLRLAEAAQVHGVGDQLDAVHGCEDQRGQDRGDVLEALTGLGLLAHVDAARLLGQRDRVVVALHIREVAQGQRQRRADLVADADAVEAGGELARVGRQEEDHAERDHGQILGELRDLVEHLLLGDDVDAAEGEQHVPRAVDLDAVFRREQEGQNEVGDQKDQHIDHHQPDLSVAHLGNGHDRDGDDHHQQDHADVVGDHDRRRQQQKADQLAEAAQPVDERVQLAVGEYLDLKLHGFSPADHSG